MLPCKGEGIEVPRKDKNACIMLKNNNNNNSASVDLDELD